MKGRGTPLDLLLHNKFFYFFLRYLMQNESRSLSGIRTLLQHLCTKVTDRAEYRTKVAQVSTIAIQCTGMHTSYWLTHHLNMWISKTFEVDKYFCYCLLIYPNVLHNPRDTETFYFPCFAFAPFTFSSSHTFNFCSLNIQYAFIDCFSICEQFRIFSALLLGTNVRSEKIIK